MTEPRYTFQDQGGTYILTRSEVLKTYFERWAKLMRKAGKEDQISEDACIEDWKTIYWAWEVHDETSPG